MKDKVRNPAARSPLLRKGGPHRPSKSGRRSDVRKKDRREAEAWLEQRRDDRKED